MASIPTALSGGYQEAPSLSRLPLFYPALVGLSIQLGAPGHDLCVAFLLAVVAGLIESFVWQLGGPAVVGAAGRVALWLIMSIAMAMPVAKRLHELGRGVAQVGRHFEAGLCGSVGLGALPRLINNR